MKARALLSLAALVAALTPLWWPRVADASVLCPQPAVSSISPAVAATGAAVTVAGSGFQAAGCATTVYVNGQAVTPQSVQPGQVRFAAGSGLSGGVSVRLTDATGNANTSNANLTFFTAAATAGVSPAAPAAAQGVTVNGHGFDLHLPARQEAISAAYLASDGSTCASAPALLVSDSAISLGAPGRYCDGPVSLSISGPTDLSNPTAPRTTVYTGDPGSIDVAATGVTLQTASATAGGTAVVRGSGLGGAGSAAVGGAPAAASWSDTQVTLTVPDTAVNNAAITLKRAGDGATMAVGGSLLVAARVDGVSPSSVAPGGTVTAAGGGFGRNPGAVRLGATNLPVLSWTPTAISVLVLPGAHSGPLTVTPADTEPPATAPVLTVLPAPPTLTPTALAAATAAIVSASTSTVVAPSAAPPVVGSAPPAWHQPPPPTGPITLLMTTRTQSAAPGSDVPFTATLRAFGQPVAGATVQLSIVYEPASDGAITPATAITDGEGRVRGSIHLSRVAGEMIVLARSGQVSNEIRVLGSRTTAAHVALSDLTPPRIGATGGVIGVVVSAALLLLLAGVTLRLASTDAARGARVLVTCWLHDQVRGNHRNHRR